MPETSTAAVDLSGLTKVYTRTEGDVRAVDDLTLAFEHSTSTAIMGASGSGKSTLLSLIAGLERPTSGRLTVLGQQLGSLGEDELADLRRERMGFVFQNYHLIPTLSVLENVMLPLVPIEGVALNLRARALKLIEKVGLEKRLKHLPSELSGGEQQRVGLARALLNDPDLLLADEPTGNLDAESEAAILDLLFELAGNTQRTIILTTHSATVAARCGTVARLDEGRLAP